METRSHFKPPLISEIDSIPEERDALKTPYRVTPMKMLPGSTFARRTVKTNR